MNPFRSLLPLTLAFALSSLVGCGAAEDVADDEATGTTEDELTQCNAGSKTAYQNGRNLGAVRLMRIDGELTTIKTGHAYLKLRSQMANAGVTISINSGFRTMDEQQYFYNCYRTKRCNGGNLAAKPGYSNHQHGRALDLQISNHTKFKKTLKSLGLTGKWKNTVRGERWHWEYFGTDPGGVCNGDSAVIGEETELPIDETPIAPETDNTFEEDDAVDYADENIDDDDEQSEEESASIMEPVEEEADDSQESDETGDVQYASLD